MNSGEDQEFNNISFKIQHLNTLKFGVHTNLLTDMYIMTTINNLLISTMNLQPLKFFIFYPGFQLSTNKFSIKAAKDSQKEFTNGGLIDKLLKKTKK